MGGIPALITAGPSGNDVTVDNNFGCQVNDITLAMQSDHTCAMSTASAVSAASSMVPATVTLKDTAGATVGAKLACLGKWNEITYAVNNGNLERAGEVTAPGIVNLQAQYGVSGTATSNLVTSWVDASGTWASPSVADRKRIKAIRIAVVARSAKMEPANVTTAALTSWVGSSTAPTIDLSADANWQKYRYRVFETIIPLRNVIWSKDVL
jgi:type IV pilus assembly protein PilW